MFVCHSHVDGIHQRGTVFAEEKKDHPIGYKITIPRVLPVRNDTLCEHGSHQFNINENNKRLTVCTYQKHVLIYVQEFIGGAENTDASRCDALLRQMK